MGYTSNSEAAPVRGFTPALNDQERMVMRRAEDLLNSAQSQWCARYSGFLSDREQDLCAAALNRMGCGWYRVEGGYPDAERRLLCLEPQEGMDAPPIVCIRAKCSGSTVPVHKDYLGALMGLSIQRSSLGDILLDPDHSGCAYLFALQSVSQLILQELTSVGRASVSTSLCAPEEVQRLAQMPHQQKTATVSSLRADAVLAAMLNCSRSVACDLIRAGRVEIRHIPVTAPHAPVYEGDIFTIRGKGRFKLQRLGGKSRKDRLFIEFVIY